MTILLGIVLGLVLVAVAQGVAWLLTRDRS